MELVYPPVLNNGTSTSNYEIVNDSTTTSLWYDILGHIHEANDTQLVVPFCGPLRYR
jgi:hypothetical protein